MRLVTTDPERQRDVVILSGDETIDCLDLVRIAAQPFGKLSRLRLDLRSDDDLRALQFSVPPTDVFPTVERRHLYRWLRCSLLSRQRGLAVCFLAHCVSGFPAVNSPPAFLDRKSTRLNSSHL